MNTKDKGDISESKVQARYMELGYTVLEPKGDNKRYDIVVQPPESDEFVRVQIKTARSKNSGEKIKFARKVLILTRRIGTGNILHRMLMYSLFTFQTKMTIRRVRGTRKNSKLRRN